MILNKKRDPQKTSIISNIFRFIDDLYIFNNDESKNKFNDIYPLAGTTEGK